jgi:hypothetical protein
MLQLPKVIMIPTFAPLEARPCVRPKACLARVRVGTKLLPVVTVKSAASLKVVGAQVDLVVRCAGFTMDSAVLGLAPACNPKAPPREESFWLTNGTV